ncbi:MAG: mannitol dehydrogenase family protein, partial [Endomicrobiales bacterium]
MKDLVVVGAGAIGRGYLPWVFGDDLYNFVFVDTNKELIDSLNKQKQYRTYRVRSNKLEERTVPVKKAYLLSDFKAAMHRDAAAVFMSVGPRNCQQVSHYLKGI